MSEKYPHFMLDIETLGTGPNAAVIQIGAAGFNPDTGEVSPASRMRVRSHEKSDITESTVRWWMQQSEEARASLFGDEATRYEPEVAMHKLNQMFCSFGTEDFKVWSKPSTFDIVILESLYKHTGHPVPWAHWNTRCLRTLIDVAGLTKQDEVVPVLPHDAGEDAKAQALTAIKCFAKLKGQDA